MGLMAKMRLLIWLMPLLFQNCDKESRPDAELACIESIGEHLTFMPEGDSEVGAFYVCDGTLLCHSEYEKCRRFGNRKHYVRRLGFFENF